MKILALESSGMVAGVAVLEDGTLLAEYGTNYKKTHSQTLLPMLEELRRMIELDLDSIDAIAVASGPGSFTGLRIGAATAKGLGLALEKPIVEVPTLEGLAYNMCGCGGDIFVCPLMDARRSQVYTGIYEFGEPEDGQDGIPVLRVVEPQAALDMEALLGKINELGERYPGRRVVFLGDGAAIHRQRIQEEIRMPCAFAPVSSNCQRAASVAALGAVYYRMGKAVAAAEHRPEYLRKSQAERELQEKAIDKGRGKLC